MDIALTKEMENFIQQQVQSGLYKDASDVVRDALRHLARNTEPQWLEEEMRKGLESGPARKVDQAFWDDFKQRAEQRLGR